MLKNLTSGEWAVLRDRYVVGRNRTDVHLYIGDNDISRHHAYLFWQDSTWLLRDVSRNGVWVNNQRINPVQAVELNPRDEIRFGQQNVNTWALLDTNAPRSALVPISQDCAVITLDAYNAIPAGNSTLEIIQESSNRWLLCKDGQLTELADGQFVEINGATWQAHLVPDNANNRATEKVPLEGIDCMQLQFQVSHDEEHVTLHAQLDGGSQIDFGERTHHYLLLILARKRYQDWGQGFDEAAQGWLDMDTLCNMLGMEASHVNIQIHRARKQLKEALLSIVDIGDLIERRVGSLRVRARRFQIYKGSQLEASLPSLPMQ